MRIGILLSFAALGLAVAAPAMADDIDATRTTKTRTKTKTKVENKDRDADVAVSTTRTTSAVNDPRSGRDVVESRAEDRREVESRRVTLAPMLGYGTNDLGVGVGARVGYTFEAPVYLGGNFMYHAGENSIRSAYYASAELGYDIGAGPVLLRPYAGTGAFFRNTVARDTSTALVYPGFTVHYLIPRSPAFVGGDARVLIPLEGSAAVALTASTGLNF